MFTNQHFLKVEIISLFSLSFLGSFFDWNGNLFETEDRNKNPPLFSTMFHSKNAIKSSHIVYTYKSNEMASWKDLIFNWRFWFYWENKKYFIWAKDQKIPGGYNKVPLNLKTYKRRDKHIIAHETAKNDCWSLS